MVYHPDDTIAAIASAAGGAARGILRLSGPRVTDALTKCFTPSVDGVSLADITRAEAVQGTLHIADASVSLPAMLFFWPNEQSYTRQPTAELHTLGASALLQELLHQVCSDGVRLAEPGEFTMRAFLAGRLDLTQAEAVLGLIDARSDAAFDSALTQLAGGLSHPLASLREQLLQILALLEAGLDFVEEDIEFVTAEQMQSLLVETQETISHTLDQMTTRHHTADFPRVVLTGPPNVGKSSLFNSLVEQYGVDEQTYPALVSEQSGTTRDYVQAMLTFDGLLCELIDTAGTETNPTTAGIARSAQTLTSEQVADADLRIHCREGGAIFSDVPKDSAGDLLLQTKSDLGVAEGAIMCCSSKTGAGIGALAEAIRRRLLELDSAQTGVVAATAARCHKSLQEARETLARAEALVAAALGEELVAAEIRHALTCLGRVVGTVYTDDVLDRIFSQFCIGK